MRYRWPRVTLVLATVSISTAVFAVSHAQAQSAGAVGNLPLWVSAGISILALLAAGWIVFRSVHSVRSRRTGSDPFIVFPVREDVTPFDEPGSSEAAAPPPAARPRSREAPREPTPAEPAATAAFAAPSAPASQASAGRTEQEPPSADVVEGQTVRFHRPAEGTLQLLPGRLEIVDGADQGQEIRFVRSRAGTPEVTFGRSNGPPLRHIQLRASTVSRRHARMRLEGEQWQITNLSLTNPVVLNGEELPTGNGSRPLNEGDRIEMGEVVFRFREQ